MFEFSCLYVARFVLHELTFIPILPYYNSLSNHIYLFYSFSNGKVNSKIEIYMIFNIGDRTIVWNIHFVRILEYLCRLKYTNLLIAECCICRNKARYLSWRNLKLIQTISLILCANWHWVEISTQATTLTKLSEMCKIRISLNVLFLRPSH